MYKGPEWITSAFI